MSSVASEKTSVSLSISSVPSEAPQCPSVLQQYQQSKPQCSSVAQQNAQSKPQCISGLPQNLSSSLSTTQGFLSTTQKPVPMLTDMQTNSTHCQPTQQGPVYANCQICSKLKHLENHEKRKQRVLERAKIRKMESKKFSEYQKRLKALKKQNKSKLRRCTVCKKLVIQAGNKRVNNVTQGKIYEPNECLSMQAKKVLDHKENVKLQSKENGKKKSLDIHSQLHYKPELHCDGCHLDFDKHYRFVLHKKKDPIMHKRKSCSKKKTLHAMNPGNQSESFKCAVCGKKFRYKKWLDHHQMTFQDLKHKRFCFVCGIMFKLPTKMRKHMKSHTKAPEKSRRSKFLCHICGRLFKQISSMWGHIRAHTVKEIKNSGTLTHPPDRSSVHECGLCVRVFSKKSYLLIHRKVHERPDTQKCQVCNGVFGSLGALNRHKRNVHQMYINI
ncbi:zinc finger protein 596-like [Saccostrea cucullata]|uniref:zinc finger protein 596-like n=1 Tax=Saccostrea cuccullata TaxID=36930 RepID=UPI002ED2A014